MRLRSPKTFRLLSQLLGIMMKDPRISRLLLLIWQTQMIPLRSASIGVGTVAMSTAASGSATSRMWPKSPETLQLPSQLLDLMMMRPRISPLSALIWLTPMMTRRRSARNGVGSVTPFSAASRRAQRRLANEFGVYRLSNGRGGAHSAAFSSTGDHACRNTGLDLGDGRHGYG
ncbi:hypothetical protein BDV96DRAFT_577062 [Lophiotrema nucula]|uniref:Uncharacterized protein n=1 Tax=Lophiotrema nucula TaxID=690887 RepID=A0A6A5Z696_9PLEO|nr:hypothetical protein BDV96DRAFT_577062 [Lophiotrema nucula]